MNSNEAEKVELLLKMLIRIEPRGRQHKLEDVVLAVNSHFSKIAERNLAGQGEYFTQIWSGAVRRALLANPQLVINMVRRYAYNISRMKNEEAMLRITTDVENIIVSSLALDNVN